VADAENAGDWLVYLTASEIESVVVDGNFIWATSSGGLLRWDRTTGDLTQYVAPTSPLPRNNLGGLALHDGKLYMASGEVLTTGGEITVFDREDEWTTVSDEGLSVSISYNAKAAAADGTVWVESDQGLIRLSPEGRWQAVPGFPLPGVSQIVVEEDGVYVYYEAGGADDLVSRAARYVDGEWEELENPPLSHLTAPDGSWWRRGWPDRTGELLRSTDEGENWSSVYTGGILIRPVAVDEQGLVYASDEDCIRVFDGPELTESFCYTDVGPQLEYLNLIERDEVGRTWFATDGNGLTMFDGERWRNWNPENSDLREDAIRGLAVGGGKVYAGVYACGGCGGVSIYDVEQDSWTNLWPEESELSGGGVGGIAIDAEGRVYLPTVAGVLDIYDDGEWEHIQMTPAASDVPIVSVFGTNDGLFDKDGNFWVATEGSGVLKYDGSEWQGFDTRHGLPSGAVNALTLEADGSTIWAATTGGLARGTPDGQWQAYLPPGTTYLDAWFDDVAVSPENHIWAIANEVLAVFDGANWQTFPPETVGGRLWGDTISFDEQGRAWVGIDEGVAIFRGTLDLEPRAVGSAPTAESAEVPEDLEGSITYTTVPYNPLRPFLIAGLVLVVVGLGIIGVVVSLIRRGNTRGGAERDE
jgi:sugar lactone lactonase YvrE